MRYNKEIREFVKTEMSKLTLPELKFMVSQTITELSQYYMAESNVNQILFYAKVLHYLKYKYNEKESS